MVLITVLDRWFRDRFAQSMMVATAALNAERLKLKFAADREQTLG
jgi:hypothetical protein